MKIKSKHAIYAAVDDITQKYLQSVARCEKVQYTINNNQDLSQDGRIRQLNEVAKQIDAVQTAADTRLAELRQAVKEWSVGQSELISYTDSIPVALTKNEMTFLESLNFLRLGETDYMQLCTQIAADPSASPALKKALTIRAEQDGYRIEGLYKSPADIAAEYDRLLDAATIATKPATTDKQIAVKEMALNLIKSEVEKDNGRFTDGKLINVPDPVTVTKIVTEDSNTNEINKAVQMDEPQPETSVTEQVETLRQLHLINDNETNKHFIEAEINGLLSGTAAAEAQKAMFDKKFEPEPADS